MTVPEVARALGLSLSAVRKAIARGTLAARLEGGAYQVTSRELARYRRDHLLSRHDEARDREAYRALAGELAALPLEDCDPYMVALARTYARRRRAKWPPRPLLGCENSICILERGHPGEHR